MSEIVIDLTGDPEFCGVGGEGLQGGVFFAPAAPPSPSPSPKLRSCCPARDGLTGSNLAIWGRGRGREEVDLPQDAA